MKINGENKGHTAWHRLRYEEAMTDDRLIFNLRDMSHTMRSLYEGKGSQKGILMLLEETGGCITQRKLTQRLGIKPGSVSEVIAKLEAAGHIRRKQNETDRRTVDIELTESGRALAKEVREQRIHRHEQMFSCLSDGEKQELLSLLERVNADWEERYRDVRDSRRGCETHRRDGHGHGNNHGAKGE